MKTLFHHPSFTHLEHKHQSKASTSQQKSIMKTFLILALLAMAATMATAQFDPSEQYWPYPEQEPFLQQQPFFQQQQPFFQPLLQQQLNPCRQFLVQQCSPMAAVPFRRSQILQQSSCQVTRQQCCQQLAQIPEQLRCPAIHSVVQSIILQQQQQFFQPQQQQGFFQPQQQGQIEGMRAFALQALPAMCDVYVPPHCSVATSPFAGFLCSTRFRPARDQVDERANKGNKRCQRPILCETLMKTFLILALLAMAATMATANVQLDPFFQQQPPFFWQQPFLQPLQQQLNPCRQFLLQQCSPVAAVPFLWSQILQQSSCQVMQQQCCRQLAQIPEQLRCPAIHSIVQAIIMQQQQQQQFFLPQQQGFFQPLAQQLSQGFFQPQQQAQFEGMRAFALQALPAMCDVYVPPHCSVATAPFSGL